VPGSSTIANAASYMMDKGGVVVVSAGNDNADMGYTNSPYLFTTAATTSSDVRASYSNFGTYVDIAAPGSSIFTTDRGGGYASVSGTSFASPNAAATLALVMSANPSLTPTDVTSIVVQTAKDLGDAGWDANYGFGRVDAGAATALAANVATNDTTPPAVALKSPGTGTTVSQVVPVSINATDAFGVTRVDLLVDGVVRASETQQVETGVYAFAWDSSVVGDGSHRIAAQAVDAAGNVGKAQDVIVTVANTKDTTPPVVTISSPAPNAKVSGSVSISAYATDNKGVTELKVYGNGALLCAGTSSASCSWSLTKVTGTATISATAKDAAGNQATSSVNVTVSTTTITYPRKKPRRY
jgi:subtilisin family serine protease